MIEIKVDSVKTLRRVFPTILVLNDMCSPQSGKVADDYIPGVQDWWLERLKNL